jgi:hypothetical protein
MTWPFPPLYTTPPVAQQEPDAYGYAKRLAEAIWQKHYKATAPQWKPLDDLIGVLTQIDNMTAGLTTPPAAPVQEPVYKVTVVDDQHPNGVPLEQWGTPPAAQRKPLTQAQIESGRRASWGFNSDYFTAGVRFAEAAHGIEEMK